MGFAPCFLTLFFLLFFTPISFVSRLFGKPSLDRTFRPQDREMYWEVRKVRGPPPNTSNWQVAAAAVEKRFCRRKHTYEFPKSAIEYLRCPTCLDSLAAWLRCIPVPDHAAKSLFITSCCRC